MRRNRLVSERFSLVDAHPKQEGFLQHRFTIQFGLMCVFFRLFFQKILSHFGSFYTLRTDEAPRASSCWFFLHVDVSVYDSVTCTNNK